MTQLRWLVREWRSGELALLLLSLVLAVSIVTGITGFADRLQVGIESESKQFLAADLVLSSSREIAPEQFAVERLTTIRTAKIAEFRSMILVGDAMQLASIKAVSNTYPLKGKLKISDRAFGLPEEAVAVPAPGEAWLDSRLFPLLGLKPGDEFQLGQLPLRASKALVSEPDRGNGYYGMGPRVLINLADVDASGVVQPGSLVDYRYLFAGSAVDLNSLRTNFEAYKTASDRWQQLDDSQPQIAKTLRRAERFLMLAGSFGVALAGVAIALAARRYSQRHLDVVAVMKALGASNRRIFRLYAGNLFLLAIVASVVGWLLGLLLQNVLFYLIKELVSFTVPASGWKPVVAGTVTALVCILSFALPPVMSLKSVPPLRVLRRDVGVEQGGALVGTVFGMLGMFALVWWYTRSLELVLAVGLGVLVVFLVSSVLVLNLFNGLRKSVSVSGGVTRLALSAMQRRRWSNAFQVVSLSLAVMVLLCLAALRSTLLDEWQLQLPDNAPNNFLINIAPEQVDGVNQWFVDNGIQSAGVYPMVRGRLVAIDGLEVSDIPEADSGRRMINREINLSWAEQLPEDNELIEGRWWPRNQHFERESIAAVSVEQGFADRLNIGVGSTLGFSIGGLPLHAKVSSIRSLRWDSMRPNFFLIFEPGVLNSFPSSSITSFYLDPLQKARLNSLLQEFPTISLIEMDTVIEQARTVMQQVSAALQLVLMLIIAAVLLVGAANIQSSLDSRLHENAVLRSLGASRRMIRTGLLVEFGLIGFMSGGLAAMGAEISLYALQTRLLDINASWHPLFWLLTPMGAALLVGVCGWWYCRAVVNSPPLLVLREL